MVVTLINLVAVSVSKHLHLDLSGSIIGLFEKQQNSSFRYQHWTCIQTGYYASWNHVGKGQRTCLHSFFDVTVDKEAERLAEEMGMDYVPTLYKGFFDSYPRNSGYYFHIFDSFKAYNEEITEAKRKDAAPQAVWPCRLKIITASCKREPIILGIDFRPQPDFVGQIVKNLKRVVVAVKIEHAVYQSAKVFGRHFDEKDEILSHVTRRSIDVLKVC